MSSPCDPRYAPAGDVSAALMVIDSRLKALLISNALSSADQD